MKVVISKQDWMIKFTTMLTYPMLKLFNAMIMAKTPQKIKMLTNSFMDEIFLG